MVVRGAGVNDEGDVHLGSLGRYWTNRLEWKLVHAGEAIYYRYCLLIGEELPFLHRTNTVRLCGIKLFDPGKCNGLFNELGLNKPRDRGSGLEYPPER